MTKDEIKLVIFLLTALVAGTVARWWIEHTELSESNARLTPPQMKASGWVKPPYCFQTRAVMERRAAEARQTRTRKPPADSSRAPNEQPGKGR